jgi:hypothetical protein
VKRAWKAELEDGSNFPPGVGLVLRGATAVVAGPDIIRLVLPGGTAAIEKVTDPRALLPIQASLGRRLGREVTVRIVPTETAGAAGAERRITAESARQERLDRLSAEEPLLSAAVKEWDLELME